MNTLRRLSYTAGKAPAHLVALHVYMLFVNIVEPMSAVFYNLYALYLSVIYIGDVYVQYAVFKIQGFYSVEIFRHESAAGVESEILERNAGQRDCGVPQNGSFLSRADRARIQNIYAYIGSLVGTRQNYIRLEAEKLRAEFIANVSHDLRTPLTMIKAYAEMIRDISGDNREKRNAHLRVIIQESDRLSELVSDLLDVSQLQAGALAYDPSVFDLTVLTKKVIGRLDLLCEKTGRKITVNTQEAVFVVGDIKKIQQVVYNLVTNALNYSGDSSMVDVLIEDIGDDKICFSVKDYGEGIAEEDLPNIWDRYYRVDKEHKRQIAGTGIGLSIVKSVLELHGTEYGVESTLGEGSRFWFILKKGREADTNE